MDYFGIEIRWWDIMNDEEKLIDYLEDLIKGKAEYLFYKASPTEISVIQDPHAVRDKKSILVITVTKYD